MSVRELISWRDVAYCFLAALAMTLVFCGIPYLAAGGPMPVAMAATSGTAQKTVAVAMDGTVAAVGPVAAVSPVIVHRISVVSAVSYRVKPGDYLSKISAKFYHKAADWPVIYWANHKSIHYPNVITAGQVLLIPALPTHIPAPPAVLAPTAPRPLVDAATPPATQQKIVEQAAPVRTAPSSGYSVSSSFQACVIRAESGGNSQIWNASGHYGLYQFSAATWAAYGGSAADFGHASAAEQTQVFDNAMATAGGASNWAPYDGC